MSSYVYVYTTTIAVISAGSTAIISTRSISIIRARSITIIGARSTCPWNVRSGNLIATSDYS